jgi:hypothetical protein
MSRSFQLLFDGVDHLIIEADKSFADVKAALERDVPPLNTKIIELLRAGDVAGARTELEQGPELAIFGVRDHGGLLAIAGKPRHALQYDIGNPLTASKMSRHELFAALYAPLRVVLYENAQGGATFEYDKPSHLFGQTGNAEILAVARGLDAAIARVLLSAAG